MATHEGALLVADALRFQRDPAGERQFRRDAIDFANSLQNRPDIIDAREASILLHSVEQIGNETRPERADSAAAASIQNVSIALIGAATVVALPIVGSAVYGTAGFFGGGIGFVVLAHLIH